MAIDTADKRASTIGSSLDFLAVLPIPDGLALDAGDRAQVAALYRGIETAVPAPPVDFTFIIAIPLGFATIRLN